MSTIGSNVLNSVNGNAAAQAAAAASKSNGADLQDSFMTLLGLKVIMLYLFVLQIELTSNLIFGI